jgi:hypothetical protein
MWPPKSIAHDFAANEHSRAGFTTPVLPHPRDLRIANLVEQHGREFLVAGVPHSSYVAETAARVDHQLG